MALFQSTHPRGVRLQGKTLIRPRLPCFNPRTRGGCDRVSATRLCARTAFQSTHPRGVRLDGHGSAPIPNMFQSTHPRGVRRFSHFPICYAIGVSIHAPAGGATSVGYFAHSIVRMFQSTHPRGVRRLFFGIFARVRWVSIHAPAGGATSSTPYKGGMNSFQSTHPRGVRRLDCTTCGSWHCFNPRTRGGCDCKEKP
jgi:hypothetical protein